MIRARRLWNFKLELNAIIDQLRVDVNSIKFTDIQSFVFESCSDELLLKDDQFLLLREFYPHLVISAGSNSSGSSSNSSMDSHRKSPYRIHKVRSSRGNDLASVRRRVDWSAHSDSDTPVKLKKNPSRGSSEKRVMDCNNQPGSSPRRYKSSVRKSPRRNRRLIDGDVASSDDNEDLMVTVDISDIDLPMDTPVEESDSNGAEKLPMHQPLSFSSSVLSQVQAAGIPIPSNTSTMEISNAMGKSISAAYSGFKRNFYSISASQSGSTDSSRPLPSTTDSYSSTHMKLGHAQSSSELQGIERSESFENINVAVGDAMEESRFLQTSSDSVDSFSSDFSRVSKRSRRSGRKHSSASYSTPKRRSGLINDQATSKDILGSTQRLPSLPESSSSLQCLELAQSTIFSESFMHENYDDFAKSPNEQMLSSDYLPSGKLEGMKKENKLLLRISKLEWISINEVLRCENPWSQLLDLKNSFENAKEKVGSVPVRAYSNREQLKIETYLSDLSVYSDDADLVEVHSQYISFALMDPVKLPVDKEDNESIDFHNVDWNENLCGSISSTDSNEFIELINSKAGANQWSPSTFDSIDTDEPRREPEAHASEEPSKCPFQSRSEALVSPLKVSSCECSPLNSSIYSEQSLTLTADSCTFPGTPEAEVDNTVDQQASTILLGENALAFTVDNEASALNNADIKASAVNLREKESERNFPSSALSGDQLFSASEERDNLSVGLKNNCAISFSTITPSNVQQLDSSQYIDSFSKTPINKQAAAQLPTDSSLMKADFQFIDVQECDAIAHRSNNSSPMSLSDEGSISSEETPSPSINKATRFAIDKIEEIERNPLEKGETYQNGDFQTFGMVNSVSELKALLNATTDTNRTAIVSPSESNNCTSSLEVCPEEGDESIYRCVTFSPPIQTNKTDRSRILTPDSLSSPLKSLKEDTQQLSGKDSLADSSHPFSPELKSSGADISSQQQPILSNNEVVYKSLSPELMGINESRNGEFVEISPSKTDASFYYTVFDPNKFEKSIDEFSTNEMYSDTIIEYESESDVVVGFAEIYAASDMSPVIKKYPSSVQMEVDSARFATYSKSSEADCEAISSPQIAGDISEIETRPSGGVNLLGVVAFADNDIQKSEVGESLIENILIELPAADTSDSESTISEAKNIGHASRFESTAPLDSVENEQPMDPGCFVYLSTEVAISQDLKGKESLLNISPKEIPSPVKEQSPIEALIQIVPNPSADEISGNSLLVETLNEVEPNVKNSEMTTIFVENVLSAVSSCDSEYIISDPGYDDKAEPNQLAAPVDTVSDRDYEDHDCFVYISTEFPVSESNAKQFLNNLPIETPPPSWENTCSSQDISFSELETGCKSHPTSSPFSASIENVFDPFAENISVASVLVGSLKGAESSSNQEVAPHILPQQSTAEIFNPSMPTTITSNDMKSSEQKNFGVATMDGEAYVFLAPSISNQDTLEYVNNNQEGDIRTSVAVFTDICDDLQKSSTPLSSLTLETNSLNDASNQPKSQKKSSKSDSTSKRTIISPPKVVRKAKGQEKKPVADSVHNYYTISTDVHTTSISDGGTDSELKRVTDIIDLLSAVQAAAISSSSNSEPSRSSSRNSSITKTTDSVPFVHTKNTNSIPNVPARDLNDSSYGPKVSVQVHKIESRIFCDKVVEATSVSPIVPRRGKDMQNRLSNEMDQALRGRNGSGRSRKNPSQILLKTAINETDGSVTESTETTTKMMNVRPVDVQTSGFSLYNLKDNMKNASVQTDRQMSVSSMPSTDELILMKKSSSGSNQAVSNKSSENISSSAATSSDNSSRRNLLGKVRKGSTSAVYPETLSPLSLLRKIVVYTCIILVVLAAMIMLFLPKNSEQSVENEFLIDNSIASEGSLAANSSLASLDRHGTAKYQYIRVVVMRYPKQLFRSVSISEMDKSSGLLDGIAEPINGFNRRSVVSRPQSFLSLRSKRRLYALYGDIVRNYSDYSHGPQRTYHEVVNRKDLAVYSSCALTPRYQSQSQDTMSQSKIDLPLLMESVEIAEDVGIVSLDDETEVEIKERSSSSQEVNSLSLTGEVSLISDHSTANDSAAVEINGKKSAFSQEVNSLSLTGEVSLISDHSTANDSAAVEINGKKSAFSQEVNSLSSTGEVSLISDHSTANDSAAVEINGKSAFSQEVNSLSSTGDLSLISEKSTAIDSETDVSATLSYLGAGRSESVLTSASHCFETGSYFICKIDIDEMVSEFREDEVFQNIAATNTQQILRALLLVGITRAINLSSKAFAKLSVGLRNSLKSAFLIFTGMPDSHRKTLFDQY